MKNKIEKQTQELENILRSNITFDWIDYAEMGEAPLIEIHSDCRYRLIVTLDDGELTEWVIANENVDGWNQLHGHKHILINYPLGNRTEVDSDWIQAMANAGDDEIEKTSVRDSYFSELVEYCLNGNEHVL